MPLASNETEVEEPSEAGDDASVKVVGGAEPESRSRRRWPFGDGAAGDGAGGRRSRRELVLAALAVLGLVGTIAFGLAWNHERNQDASASALRSTARDFLIALTNFDGATIDRDFDNLTSFATGEFATQADQFFGGDVREALKEVQASSRGEIRSLWVQSVDGDRGRVFAVIDQTIANNQFPAPQADEVRIELGLQKVDGDWKVFDVVVLQAPPSAVAPGAGAVPSEPAPEGESDATSTTATTATTVP